MDSNRYYVGIEREGLRCTKEGELSDLPHPKIFGKHNDFFSTDWSQAQMELRTPICTSTKECYEKLENITDVALNELRKKDELLWPYSMPCILPEDSKFKFLNQHDKQYKLNLLKKYSSAMLCMSGIHVNFSINREFLKKMHEINKKVPKNVDDAYLKIMNAFIKKAWILIYLFGATPLQNGEKSYKCKYSIRNSYKEGFKNNKLLDLDFESKQKYIESIEKNIKEGYISSARELYTPIRAKGIDKNDVEWLKKHNINHIEVRICDLNPFDKCAISKEELDFIIAFLFNCLVDEDEYSADYRQIAEKGITKEQKEIITQEFKKIENANNEFNLEFKNSIKQVYEQCMLKSNYSSDIEKIIKENGYINGILKLANKHSDNANNNKYSITHDGKIVTATAAIIKDALSQGIDYKILNHRDYDCFVEFTHGKHKEYVIGGTKTDKDNYILPYITDDKYFAKQLMSQNKINVPSGIMLSKEMSEQEKEKRYSQFYNKPVVVKPRSTNGGTGITVFSKNVDSNNLQKAIEYAFEFDNNVLLEEYIAGKEYRFIVINGKCISVVLRRSASVVGDGKSTIQELIEKKDKEPWHYLLKNRMKIDSPLKMFLKQQNLSLEYIPKQNERIYLRENSNCSTGGESVNVTKEIPAKFKKIAEKAAKVFKAKVCGVDIIINDWKKDDYAIIEINDDPGYDINEWPYEGEDTRIGLQILKMLKLAN